jgi:hypothetical protein
VERLHEWSEGGESGLHEQVRGDGRGGSVTQLVCEAFSERLDGGLGRVVSGVSAIKIRWLDYNGNTERHDRERERETYGGFVMPCLDPVLMITDGFSWASMEGTNVCCTFTIL